MKWKRVKYLMLGLAVGLLLLLIWGAAVEPRFVDYNEETVVIPNLPSAWENRQVALIADFQVGMWLGNEDTVKKIINRLVERRPAVVLIAGDFVYKPTDEDEQEDVEREDALDFMNEVNESVALVRPLTDAGIPVYAVLGNHDYGMNYPDSAKNERLASSVRQKLETAGVTVLDNAAVPLAQSNASGEENNPMTNAAATNFYIVGIGSRYANNDKPKAALSQVPNGSARIIFMHNPDTFAAFPPNSAPLALAGHTHGGQIRIPSLPEWSWMSLMKNEKIQADGWIDGFGQPGNSLYVNRGIGFSSFPVRINCRPELTLFTLRGGNS